MMQEGAVLLSNSARTVLLKKSRASLGGWTAMSLREALHVGATSRKIRRSIDTGM
jgi:hypothetical protein